MGNFDRNLGNYQTKRLSRRGSLPLLASIESYVMSESLLTPVSKQIFWLTYEDEDVEEVVLEGVPPRPEHLFRVRPVQQVLLHVPLNDGSHGHGRAPLDCEASTFPLLLLFSSSTPSSSHNQHTRNPPTLLMTISWLRSTNKQCEQPSFYSGLVQGNMWNQNTPFCAERR